jgi:hypothetical protein
VVTAQDEQWVHGGSHSILSASVPWLKISKKNNIQKSLFKLKKNKQKII